MLVGTVTTLVYFHFGAKSHPQRPATRQTGQVYWVGWGQVFIAITFGVLFAGVFVAAMTALIERMNFIITILTSCNNLWPF